MSTLVLAVALAAVPISWSKPELEDFAFLEAHLAGKTVVQLGEATHGGAEFYRLKTKLVRYLHERMGFQVLAIETGALEAGLAFAKRDHLTPKELMNSSLFGTYRYAEMLPLLEYIKSRPALRVIGIDPQFASDEVLSLARDLLHPYGERLAGEVAKHLGDGYGFIGLSSKPVEFLEKRDAYLIWLERIGRHVAAIRPRQEDTAQFELLRQSLRHMKTYYDYEPATPSTDRMILRDEIMARHLSEQAQGKKTIVWAHNGHIGRGLGFTVLGDHLRKVHGSKTYALGLFAREGKWAQHWTGTSQDWSASPDGLESRFPGFGEAWFQPARAFTETMSAFEPENGGLVRFVPSDRFDGVIVVNRLSPPTKP